MIIYLGNLNVRLYGVSNQLWDSNFFFFSIEKVDHLPAIITVINNKVLSQILYGVVV